MYFPLLVLLLFQKKHIPEKVLTAFSVPSPLELRYSLPHCPTCDGPPMRSNLSVTDSRLTGRDVFVFIQPRKSRPLFGDRFPLLFLFFKYVRCVFFMFFCPGGVGVNVMCSETTIWEMFPICHQHTVNHNERYTKDQEGRSRLSIGPKTLKVSYQTLNLNRICPCLLFACFFCWIPMTAGNFSSTASTLDQFIPSACLRKRSPSYANVLVYAGEICLQDLHTQTHCTLT